MGNLWPFFFLKRDGLAIATTKIWEVLHNVRLLGMSHQDQISLGTLQRADSDDLSMASPYGVEVTSR